MTEIQLLRKILIELRVAKKLATRGSWVPDILGMYRRQVIEELEAELGEEMVSDNA